jgi:hypothetical protein
MQGVLNVDHERRWFRMRILAHALFFFVLVILLRLSLKVNVWFLAVAANSMCLTEYYTF